MGMEKIGLVRPLVPRKFRGMLKSECLGWVVDSESTVYVSPMVSGWHEYTLASKLWKDANETQREPEERGCIAGDGRPDWEFESNEFSKWQDARYWEALEDVNRLMGCEDDWREHLAQEQMDARSQWWAL